MSQEHVCVIFRSGESVSPICLNDGEKIRSYLPDRVDGRWNGPLLTTATEVLNHLAKCEEPCVVPCSLARQLFGWQMPFGLCT